MGFLEVVSELAGMGQEKSSGSLLPSTMVILGNSPREDLRLGGGHVGSTVCLKRGEMHRLCLFLEFGRLTATSHSFLV